MFEKTKHQDTLLLWHPYQSNNNNVYRSVSPLLARISVDIKGWSVEKNDQLIFPNE